MCSLAVCGVLLPTDPGTCVLPAVPHLTLFAFIALSVLLQVFLLVVSSGSKQTERMYVLRSFFDASIAVLISLLCCVSN